MIKNNIKIFITSYDDEEGHEIANRLRKLYEISDRKYSLVENPQSSDIIVIGSLGNNISDVDYLKNILINNVIDKYTNKCFSLTYRDKPFVFNRGVYESGVSNIFNFRRVKTGSYALSGSFNSYIKKHIYSSFEDCDKEYLISFIGRNSHPVRTKIYSLKFSRKDIYIEDSTNFSFWNCDNFDEIDKKERNYYNVLLKSKFSICPRGVGASSIRLFETIKLGIPPIIISDSYNLPSGPKWKEFSIMLKERHVDYLGKIATSYEDSYKEMGMMARKSYELHFADDVYFNYVVDNCLDIMKNQLVPEYYYWKMRKSIYYLLITRRKIGELIKSIFGF